MNLRPIFAIFLPLIIVSVLAACSGGDTITSAPPVKLSACPTTPVTAPPPALPASGPQVIQASTVAPSDTSTSTVISPNTADQIQCGRVSVKTVSNVTYSTPILADGTVKPLMLDISVPAGQGKRPLVIYISGGGFLISTKEAALDQRTYIAEAGFVVASVQYRTVADQATYRDTVGDVKAAIRYLRAHADDYGIDTSQVAVWGESAGGYVAAMVGVSGKTTAFDSGGNLTQSSAVQAVIDKFGPSDMSKIAADFDTATQTAYAAPGTAVALFVNGATSTEGIVTDPTAHTTANPLTYVDASDPPFLLLHGTADTYVSQSQTLILHNALLGAGVSSKRYLLNGAEHGDLTMFGNPAAGLPWTTNQVMNIMVDFLKAKLNS